MSETDIKNTLLAHAATVAATVGLPFSQPFQATFTPPANNRYLEINIFPNNTETLFIDPGDYNATGLLQITVHWGKNEGEIKPTEIADQIVSEFSYATTITGDINVKISAQPSIAPAIDGAVGITVPVTIPYRSVT